MGWLLGFGIPIGYILTGFLLSRSVYRSRHKRGYNTYHDEFDTSAVCGIMVLTWPILAPFYFGTVVVLGIFESKSLGTLGSKFYKHNLPETNEEKRLRKLRAVKDQQRQIRELEKELGIGKDEEIDV